MKLIKITTPKGKAFIMPDGSNKAYYENLNREIKDPKLQYKIEPCVEQKQTAKTVVENANNPVSDIDLTAKVVDLLPLIEKFTDTEKLKQHLEAEKAAGNRKTVIEAIQARIETLTK
jgi:hypothetical protein